VFLKGVLGNVGVWRWFLDGEFAVERVVIVDRRHHVVRLPKFSIYLRFIFASDVGECGAGTILGIVRQGTQHLRSLLC
jgi:hypothetical protein